MNIDCEHMWVAVFATWCFAIHKCQRCHERRIVHLDAALVALVLQAQMDRQQEIYLKQPKMEANREQAH